LEMDRAVNRLNELMNEYTMGGSLGRCISWYMAMDKLEKDPDADDFDKWAILLREGWSEPHDEHEENSDEGI
jgi:hypothetical protein